MAHPNIAAAQPDIFWVSPLLTDWSVASVTGEVAIFGARDASIDWACRAASRRMPAIVQVRDAGGRVTAQFSFEQARGA